MRPQLLLNNQTRVLFAQNSAYTQMGRGLRATVSAAYSGASTVEEDPDDSPFASPLQRQYRHISQALSIAAAPSNPTTPYPTIQRQVAQHLTEEEIASLEELAGELAPAQAPMPLLTSPPRIQYATNLFSHGAASYLTPPLASLTRQIAAPSRQTSNMSNGSGQRLGFISPDMSPLVNAAAAPINIPVFSLGSQEHPA